MCFEYLYRVRLSFRVCPTTTPPPYERFARACQNKNIKYVCNKFGSFSSINSLLHYSLECPTGQLIQVEYAYYGRKVGNQICPDKSVTVSSSVHILCLTNLNGHVMHPILGKQLYVRSRELPRGS